MRLSESPCNVLLPVALPSSGPELLKLAVALAPPDVDVRYHALHLQDVDEPSSGANAPARALAPLLEYARDHGIAVKAITRESASIGEDISRVAHELNAQLVLMGWYGAVSSQSEGDTVAHAVMRATRADVGLYLPRLYRPWKNVLVPVYGGPHDLAALSLARTLVTNNEIDITIFHVVTPDRTSAAPRLGIEETRIALGYRTEHVKIVESDDPHGAVVEEARNGYDLVIAGAVESFGLESSVFGTQHERLARSCPASLLVVCSAARKALGPVEDRPLKLRSSYS
jgi:nucleotide-binding universal stress UspA family protein